MSANAIASQMLHRLYEDDHYLFLAKPSGLSVNSPRRGIPWGVTEAIELLEGGEEHRGLRTCYRLDKYTSGVLGLAKSETAAERFAELAKTGSVTAQFAAVVRRKARKGPRSVSNKPADRAPAKTQTPRTENINIQVVQHIGDRATIRAKCQHLQGQKVRAALRETNSPVLGDVRFGLRPDRKQSGRFYLHLERIEFVHPFTNKHINVTAGVPDSFGAAVRAGTGGSKTPPTKAIGARASQGPTPAAKLPDKVLGGHLEVALASRVPFLLDDSTNAYRLFSGKADGISGLSADKYANVVIIQALQGKFDGGDQVISSIASWYGTRLGVRAVYTKNIPHDRSGPRRSAREATRRQEGPTASESLQNSEPIWGKPADPEILVSENNCRFLVKPYDGYLSGLFLDQRDNRKVIRELAGGRKVLNLFSYTCSFSVAAAIGGAESTASVDISKKSLEWGKQNFLANDIPLDNHKFFCSDVFEYFKRAQRQGQTFDVIVVDPPTFGRSKKPARTFQVTRDMAKLVEGAASLLNSGGDMLISTNDWSASTRWIREKVTEAAGGRTFKVTRTPDVPPDFSGSSDAAKSVWVRF